MNHHITHLTITKAALLQILEDKTEGVRPNKTVWIATCITLNPPAVTAHSSKTGWRKPLYPFDPHVHRWHLRLLQFRQSVDRLMVNTWRS